ncbi:uncharacterized protein PV07_02650 [Cladophialophora immunda]|uniref:Uncharacterized protein n=1 Tax=Cladophialophora immunda TaxID=569365 RepID=A0A0D2D5N4_9EURO|nr:uncharacterized protein PV07_02650 [Cladophialophora immunda]KIW30964.1 hypothetical protein PV07_02650 [Cladophialophora immunda]OQV11074.1 hypothetical protein CLAIMM_14974 [Cladophialophora immunda]
MYPHWTLVEELLLFDALDYLAKKPFSTVVQVVAEAHSHFLENNGKSGVSARTTTQIQNKVNGISRKLGIKPEQLLRNWEDYRSQVREGFERRGQTSTPKKRRLKTVAKSITGSDTSQSKDDDRVTVAPADEVRESPPPGSPIAPTTSPLSDLDHFHLPDSELDTDFPFRRYSMALEEWEFNFLNYLREHRGDTGYMAPLPKQHIQNILQKTMKLIDESFSHFALGTRTVMPTSSGLTGEALELSCLLVDSPRDGPTDRRLKALIAGPHMCDQILFRAYTAAAIYEWVLKPFDDNLRHIPSPNCEQCTIFNICEQYNHYIARNVSVKRANQYIDKVIRPALPRRASEIQEKLYKVLISISIPSARVGKPENKGFELQDQKLRQWQEHVEAALLDLLDMRTTMAKCSLVYGFRLPAVGCLFDGDWMEPAHPENEGFARDDHVYLCLRPAVFAQNRLENTAPPVLVSPALVMLEGYEVDLTMT